jgi:hypothetical protein
MNNAASPSGDSDMISKEQTDKGSPDSIPNIEKSQGNLNITTGSNEADSLFQKYYSKELKVNEDEIPFVLAEFTENALRYIK